MPEIIPASIIQVTSVMPVQVLPFKGPGDKRTDYQKNDGRKREETIDPEYNGIRNKRGVFVYENRNISSKCGRNIQYLWWKIPVLFTTIRPVTK